VKGATRLCLGAVVKEVRVLAVLAADWALLVFRSTIALLFGIAAVMWPNLTFVVLFVLYTLLDGIIVLIGAFHAKDVAGFRSLLLEGLVRFAAAFVVLGISGRSPGVLAAFFAAWAGLSGIGQIAEAVVLRKEMTGEWPLPTAGVLSLATAVALLAIRDVGTRTLAFVVGPYSVLFGLALMVLAVRLRHLALEMANA
jgi:uncharacterized membrane protein HdeD (DUF308 family)